LKIEVKKKIDVIFDCRRVQGGRAAPREWKSISFSQMSWAARREAAAVYAAQMMFARKGDLRSGKNIAAEKIPPLRM